MGREGWRREGRSLAVSSLALEPGPGSHRDAHHGPTNWSLGAPVTAFDILAGLTTLAAVFAWVNYRFVRLPTSIGLMVISLLFSLGLVAAGRLGVALQDPLTRLLEAVDLDETLLNGMLGALLFAGALTINLANLREQKA